MEFRKLFHWCVPTASVIAAFVIAGTAEGQGAVITGKVTTDQGREVSGANVTIPELNVSVGTNAAGNYTLTIPAARLNGNPVVIRVRAIGYIPKASSVQLSAGPQTANFSLTEDIN